MQPTIAENFHKPTDRCFFIIQIDKQKYHRPLHTYIRTLIKTEIVNKPHEGKSSRKIHTPYFHLSKVQMERCKSVVAVQIPYTLFFRNVEMLFQQMETENGTWKVKIKGHSFNGGYLQLLSKICTSHPAFCARLVEWKSCTFQYKCYLRTPFWNEVTLQNSQVHKSPHSIQIFSHI